MYVMRPTACWVGLISAPLVASMLRHSSAACSSPRVMSAVVASASRCGCVAAARDGLRDRLRKSAWPLGPDPRVDAGALTQVSVTNVLGGSAQGWCGLCEADELDASVTNVPGWSARGWCGHELVGDNEQTSRTKSESDTTSTENGRVEQIACVELENN